MDFDRDFLMTIYGEMVSASSAIDVINPATEEVFAQAPDASKDQLDAAVAAARRAFSGWKDTPVEEREKQVLQFADAFNAHAEDFMRLLTREQGKARGGAEIELGASVAWLQEVARQRLPEDTSQDASGHKVKVRHTPLGVVGAITPWNFPIILAIWKIAPALMAGNTVVLKPSPFTPLTSLKLGELARGIFPPGVLNVVSGSEPLGQWMSEHEDIDKIAFTGSTATGRKIMQSAAVNLKRLTLELGGNDPAIVLPDVDPKAIAEQLFWAAFQNSAQYCVACKRLYVHDDVYDAVLDELVAYARTVKLDDGAKQGTELGPIQNRQQFEKVKDLLDDVKANGGRIVLGGMPEDRKGYFFPVTIVDNPPDSSRVVREEAFGPILPVMKYDDFDDVVARANNSEYGLAASVWGRDLKKAEAIAERIEAGTVWINEVHVLTPHFPFGGHKQSGLGVENGIEGLREYTNTQTIMVNTAAKI